MARTPKKKEAHGDGKLKPIDPGVASEEKKPKREGVREQKRKRKAELEQLAREIFVSFERRTLKAEGNTAKEAAKKAKKRAGKMTPEQLKLYGELAFIESVFFGNIIPLKKKRKADTSKRKEEWHPFLLFCKQHRDEVLKEGNTGSAVMSVLSARWKELPKSAQDHYKDLARENKKRDLQNGSYVRKEVPREPEESGASSESSEDDGDASGDDDESSLGIPVDLCAGAAGLPAALRSFDLGGL